MVSDENPESYLLGLIEKGGELLPAQGPITAFVFLNTLQALEGMPFDQGMAKGGRLFGCNSYLTEDRYREKFAKERISVDDLSQVIRKDLGDRSDEILVGATTRHQLRLAMLRYPLRTAPEKELRWFVAETDALVRLRPESPVEVRSDFVSKTKRWVLDDYAPLLHQEKTKHGTSSDARLVGLLGDIVTRSSPPSIEQWSDATWESVALQTLWRVCRDGVHGKEMHPPIHSTFVRHRDWLMDATGEDSDLLVHDLLTRFCAAFADQGLAEWGLPHRDLGFYHSFCFLYRQGGGPPNRWLSDLPKVLARLEDEKISPIDCLFESLDDLGVPRSQWDEFITATMIALRGWTGMLRQMEVRSDRVPLPAAPGTVVEYIAIRLVLERLALKSLAKETLGYDGPLSKLRESIQGKLSKQDSTSVEQRAFQIFQLSQILNWPPSLLFQLSRKQWSELIGEIVAFSGMERRRLFHQAFERNYRVRALDALSVHTNRPPRRVENPSFQAVFCIDTREESFRRHLEEIDPQCETFGAAGFFGVAMYYKGIAEAHYSTLCPIVIRPQTWVTEEVVYTLEEDHRRRATARKALGTASRQVHTSSRSLAGGALITAGLGVLASVPLVARVLLPRLTARIRREAGKFVEAPKITRLRLERSAPDAGPEGDHIGFSLSEMANTAERMLRDIGLTSNFARLVIFMGHGSFCLNNPHKSAYDCGACSGGAGGPNARALAMMCNDQRVREILAKRGLEIPLTTRFLGGLHNTCADTISFFDLELLPMSHVHDFEVTRTHLLDTCERNAHERCRRFQSAPLDLSFPSARKHVEGRSEDLAQTRPEFGNATNAMCIVGRRARTRGLYLDRRSFLVSYDPMQDDQEYSILARILGAVVPVCSGINLQYFFSYIDSGGWGCGTKLPHNITSLLGVMDGAASDLRPGLPWQGVEIHEPLRLLMVLESTPQAIEQIMDRNPVVGRILRNGWAQLALLSPHDNSLLYFRNGKFEPHLGSITELPRAESSTQWYRGWRDHLGFAVIGK